MGRTLETTWARAVRGEAGFRKITRCEVESPCFVVGEIPDWEPEQLDFVTKKDVYNWNAQFVHLTMAVCRDALPHAGLAIDDITGPRTACLIGSALNGVDSFKAATHHLLDGRPSRISPYLLPNLCGNLPGGKAGMLLGFTGLNVSPQGACASGNHGIGMGARMIRDGDLDFVLAGGVDTPIVPEIVHGFANMNATIKVREADRAFDDIVGGLTGEEGLRGLDIGVIQVNLGLRCNQSCAHCHVGASPSRTEMMSWQTMKAIIKVAADAISTIYSAYVSSDRKGAEVSVKSYR